MAGIGDNSLGGESGKQLKALVERIERLEEEKAGIADDIKEVYGEAKATGFDTKILRKVVARRRMDRNERQEQDALLELYEGVFG
jgi:uncharacterized protein (UPF0335 family)